VNIELFAPECAVSMNFLGKFVIRLMLPFMAISILVLLYVLSQFASCWKAQKLNFRVFVKYFISLPRIRSFIGSTMVQFYTNSVSTSLSPFNCKKQPGGSYSLAKDPSVECFQAQWNSFLPLFTVGALFYVFLVPMCLCYIFWKHRHNHGSIEFHQSYHSLTYPYKYRFYYWELVVMLKRTFFVISTDFFSSADYAVKYGVAILVLFIFFWLDSAYLPYQTMSTNQLNISWVPSVVIL
jgi:hypothetical protein